MSTTTTPPVTTQEQALTADASVPEWTPPSWDEIVFGTKPDDDLA